jgi:serine phosphatase RsbU (regulator of sigma subunit)
MRYLLSILFLSACLLCKGQSKTAAQRARTIDSLERIIGTPQTDTVKIKAINALTLEIRTKEPDRTDSLCKLVLELCKKSNYKNGEPIAWANMAVVKYTFRKDFEGAIKDFNTAINICKETGDRKRMALCITNIGVVFWQQGKLPEALKKYKEGLAIQLEIKDTLGSAGTYINMGNAYLYQSDFPHALESYQASENAFGQLNDLNGIATAVTNLGAIYSYLKLYDDAIRNYEKGADLFFKIDKKAAAATSLCGVGVTYTNKQEFEKAIGYFNRALAIQEELKDNKGIVYSCIYTGDALMNMKQYEKSRSYFLRALELAEAIGDQHALISILSHLGNISIQHAEYKKAEEYLDRSLKIGLETNAREELQSVYKYLAELYKRTNRPVPALEYYQKYTDMRDSTKNEERTTELTRNQMQFEFDKEKAVSRIAQDKINSEKEAELKQQKMIRNSFIAGTVLLLILAFVIFKALREKNRSNIEISKQKAIIEEKNKDITDSINYAKRIQDAILPDLEIKERLFPDSFIILQPRDIVSGDFYWFSEKNGEQIITAADCTGHGVPGAFMSMIGNAFLTEVVNERGITEPGKVLSDLRYLVIRALKQTGAQGEQKDGMDMSLLRILPNYKADWAGANNPLWIIRRGQLIEYKGDKRPVGFYTGKGLPFTNHSIELQKGDTLYIFTDGFADQFGGPEGKKFKYARLKELLLSIQHSTMKEQESILLKTFRDWQGKLEQVDDVCIIGVRI